MAAVHPELLVKEFNTGRKVRLESPLCGASSEFAMLHLKIAEQHPSGYTDLMTSELICCIGICGGSAEATGPLELTARFEPCGDRETHFFRALDCAFRMMETIDAFNRTTAPFHEPLNAFAAVVPEGEFPIERMLRKTEPGSVAVPHHVKKVCSVWFTWNPCEDEFCLATRGAGVKNSHPLIQPVTLLGREREMEKLLLAYQVFERSGTHPPVLITGKPGIGKTLFADTFLDEAAKSGSTVVKMQNRLWDQPPLGMWLPLMNGSSFDPYTTVMSSVREMCSRGRLVILIEDIHWADTSSLRLLNNLSRTIAESGAFLVITSRSEPDGEIAGISNRLALEELSDEAACLLLSSILGRSDAAVLESVSAALAEKTGCNPLLLVELAIHLLETNGIHTEANGVCLDEGSMNGIVPFSAESIIQARLSGLLSEELEALKVASVMGNGFLQKNFALIMGQLGFPGGEITLSRLFNMGYFYNSQDGSCNFSNAICAGTVYRSITLERKKEMHRIAAEILSESGQEKDDGSGAIALARHWIESDTGERAIPWLFEALEQCIDSGDIVRADTLSRELNVRIGDDGSDPHFARLSFMDARLQIVMGKFQLALDTASRTRDFFSGRELALLEHTIAQARENLGMPLQEALEGYAKAASIAISSGDWNTAASSLASMGSLDLARGRRSEALASFNRALEYRDSLDSTAMANLHGNMGILMHRTGSHEEAIRHYRITLEMGRRAGNMGIEANALAFIGQVEINMGNREEGLKRYQEALSIHRRAGNLRGECTTLGNLGGQMARFGKTGKAIEMLERAIEIASEIGHSRGIMSFHSNLGLAHKIAGNYSKAEEHIRIAMGMISVSGDKRAMAVTHLNLSTVLAKMSRLTEAADESRRALRFACAVESLTTQARALGNLGWLMLKTDRAPLGARFFREAYRRSSLAEDLSMLADSKVGEGRALFDSGDYSGATSCLKNALELKELYGMDHEALEGLDELVKLLEESV